MSYFEDYIEDGLCCEVCGAYIDGSEPGFIRRCCGDDADPPPPKPKSERRRRERAKP